ncbi:MAG TPA: SHOCT domain-containing protein [Candidatus Acidoferrum sp.]|nr:SHOCT domain-containing protein [Candidatus Acidoferrum sp.]
MPDLNLPRGFELEDDEVVLRSAKDWGVSVNPLLLTNRRLICPSEVSGGNPVAILLRDIQDVHLRKPFIGYVTVVTEYGDHQRAAFPAHINANRIRADIAEAVERARGAKLSVVPLEPAAPDRYERLRRLGELKASGVLSDREFEAEKARILKEP